MKNELPMGRKLHQEVVVYLCFCKQKCFLCPEFICNFLLALIFRYSRYPFLFSLCLHLFFSLHIFFSVLASLCIYFSYFISLKKLCQETLYFSKEALPRNSIRIFKSKLYNEMTVIYLLPTHNYCSNYYYVINKYYLPTSNMAQFLWS
uniref:Uncharacterized protein n=1 Tax=Cacopsylla melanoneura TaxID=428564 RepID=A0A8D8URL7_9HEMI